jgi:hypothetical protein
MHGIPGSMRQHDSANVCREAFSGRLKVSELPCGHVKIRLLSHRASSPHFFVEDGQGLEIAGVDGHGLKTGHEASARTGNQFRLHLLQRRASIQSGLRS